MAFRLASTGPLPSLWVWCSWSPAERPRGVRPFAGFGLLRKRQKAVVFDSEVTLSSLTRARMSSSKMSLLRSARSLKRVKGRVDLGFRFHLDAQFLQPLLEGVAAAELAQHDLVGGPAHVFGTHDLVGVARLEHTILVDAAGVGKGVGADHGLVGLHDKAGGLADHARSRHDLRGVDAQVQGSSRAACAPPSPPLQGCSCRHVRPGR
jgi:hypothetical protein